MSKNEVAVEIFFLKRFNLGNYQHKEYSVKLSGTQSQIEEQLSNEQQKLTNYISQLESVVEIANDANRLKARIDAAAATSSTSKDEKKTEKMQEL